MAQLQSFKLQQPEAVAGTGPLEHRTRDTTSSTGDASLITPQMPNSAGPAHGTKATELLAVLRKLSWFLLPVFFILNILNYLDRTNLAFASIQMTQVCSHELKFVVICARQAAACTHCPLSCRISTPWLQCMTQEEF
jgi:hypothetical protein